MSVRGLYDSDVGDKLARETLKQSQKRRDEKIGDKTRRDRPSVKKCACGNDLVRPYIQRAKKFVCRECAVKIPRLVTRAQAGHKCVKCKKKLARVGLVLRNGKLYCKACAKGF